MRAALAAQTQIGATLAKTTFLRLLNPIWADLIRAKNKKRRFCFLNSSPFTLSARVSLSATCPTERRSLTFDGTCRSCRPHANRRYACKKTMFFALA
jgi:hypothetical protein